MPAFTPRMRHTRGARRLPIWFSLLLVSWMMAAPQAAAEDSLLRLDSLEQEGIVWFLGKGSCKITFSTSRRRSVLFVRFLVSIFGPEESVERDYLIVEPDQKHAVMKVGTNCNKITRIEVGKAECASDIGWHTRRTCPFRYSGTQIHPSN